MRRLAFCPTCILERTPRRDSCRIPVSQGTPIRLTSGAVTNWSCPVGHTAHSWVSIPFFEALFAEGLQLVADGDMRAAVLSLYAAWENFISYSIRLLMDSMPSQNEQ